MVLPAGPLPLGGVSVGFAHTHCVPDVLAQACRIVTAMITANTSNEKAIFFITPSSVAFLGLFRQGCFSRAPEQRGIRAPVVDTGAPTP
jgi:hypothetical protein